MAINANDLDKQIKETLKKYNEGDYKNEKENPQHKKILGDTMKKYFEENIEITYGWAAVLPPPASTPDPVVIFDSTVKFPIFDLTAATDPVTLAVLVQVSILGGIINHTAGFAVTPGTFLMKSPLIFPPSGDAETALYNSVVVPACTWVLTLVNPAPLTGTHGPYSGATVGMVIK
jgi:hypothetical protein